VISPLLFGAVHTYAYTFMALGVLTGSLLLLRKTIRKEIKTGAYRVELPKTSLNLAFLLLGIFLASGGTLFNYLIGIPGGTTVTK